MVLQENKPIKMLQIAFVLSLVALATSASIKFDGTDQEAWIDFQVKYAKEYQSFEEELQRMRNFASNLRFIKEHQAKFAEGMVSYEVGVNEFSDMSNEEFVKVMNGYRRPSRTFTRSKIFLPSGLTNLPKSVDWRKKGYVTEVKDQKSCGSCWAFSTTGALEGQHFKKTGKLVSLSEQNLVDCSRPEGNKGCEDGYMDFAFQYVKDNNGIDTEASYPYVGKDEKCKFKRQNVGATDTGFVDVTYGSENALKEAVATIGPISVAIDASHRTFQSYTVGIYDEPECSSSVLDHAVLVVGYGSENGRDYWIVKNSWATTWGNEGYILMSRNKDNQCGIATNASYPLV